MTQWQDDFPLRDEVEDFGGRIRAFVVSCYEGPLGFTVRAEEEGTEGNGYLFGAYSETSPYSALGRMRAKMHRALATRHISGSPGNYSLLHDELRGRITMGEDHEIQLVVDGIPLEGTDLISILASLEGWEFELRIKDALDENRPG